MIALLARLAGWKGYALAAALAYLAGGATAWKVRDWMAADAALKAAHAQTRQAVKVIDHIEKQAVVTQQIGQRAAETQVRIQSVTRTLIKEIPVYVTPAADNRCVVPVGFVRLHDAAALGVPVVPATAGQSDDGPSGVDLSAVAATIADNYGAANENAAQLEAFQSWVKAQMQIH